MLNFCQFLMLLWLSSVAMPVFSQEANNDENADTTEIQVAIDSYVAAFNARDIEKLASHWSTGGVFVSSETGERTVGRDAIVTNLRALLAGDESPTLAVATESIEFISPNVALERGVATASFTGEQAIESDYRVVYVKTGGKWLIDRVTDEKRVAKITHVAELQPLEWLIGDWAIRGDGYLVEFSCQWTKNRNFISRKFKVIEGNETKSSGLQIIGWDAKEKKIRSWLFDSDAGVVMGEWMERDGQWVVNSKVTLADGAAGSFTGIFQQTDEDGYKWKKINQVLDGKLLPNVEEIVATRQ